MSQDRKPDFRTYPSSTGFTRATPPRLSLHPQRDRALAAYQKQRSAIPEAEAHVAPAVGGTETSSSEEVQINLEDLLDSSRKAA